MQFVGFAHLLGLSNLSSCVSNMMLYMWARSNPDIVMSFLNVFVFRSCFLPHFMLALVFLSGYDPTYELIGFAAGHLYFFLQHIVPKVPQTRGIHLIKTP